MYILDVIDEDFVNYKEPTMTIEMPYCDWKCCIECGQDVCQNMDIAKIPPIDINPVFLIERYKNNPITSAICFQGLEPFDSNEEFQVFVKTFRAVCPDTIVIYTGYTEKEVREKFGWIFDVDNVVLKVGRFVPDMPHRFDDILQVELASDNQYAIKINKKE